MLIRFLNNIINFMFYSKRIKSGFNCGKNYDRYRRIISTFINKKKNCGKSKIRIKNNVKRNR